MAESNELTVVDRLESLAIGVYCKASGMDTVPYPLIVRPHAASAGALERRESEILQWLRTDPPRHLTRWIQVCMRPDISVQLSGVFLDSAGKVTRSVGIHAVRQADDGFLAVQDSQSTTATTDVSIYSVDAVRIANAIVQFTPDVAPGTLGEVMTRPSRHIHRRPATTVMERNNSPGSALHQYRSENTTFSAFVQVKPFRLFDWGYDERSMHVHWEHKADDGQYLLIRDDSELAIPADRNRLTRQINASIAKAVHVVREKRESLPANVYAGDA
ncbi:ESX secretion-associated protein EspG [Gordonia sputi]|uniref:ESX secretion-associated protein EspG n=1 Tax=Gordonia sputi TaxID=36823 RepID=UPI002043182F|nr:ESX secretion-associated protein EspG [Gordonia sputi]MCM3898042.1 ESX secretion-associated protein EspG [Gordonia sputi]